MKHITAITTQQEQDTRQRAWQAALHDSSNLITPMARTRNLTHLQRYTGRVDNAARNLLLSGGEQQGSHGLPGYSLTDYNRDVEILIVALGKETK